MIDNLFCLCYNALARSVKRVNFLYKRKILVRTIITLECTECKERNYSNMKNKKNDPDRIELNKYCKRCRKHTLHKETK